MGTPHRVALSADLALSHTLDPLTTGLFQRGTEIGDGLGEAGRTIGHADEVLQDKNLAVRGGTRAYSDDGQAGRFEDSGRGLVGDGFDEQHHRTGIFEGTGIGGELFGLGIGTTGSAVAAGESDGLGAAADVGADWNPGSGHLGDEWSEGAVHLDLDDVGLALGHEATGVADSLGVVSLIRKERHVGHDDRVGGTTLDGGGERDEDVEGHVDRAIESKDHFGSGVADQEDMKTGAFKPLRGCGIVARQAGKWIAIARHAAEGLEGNWGGVLHRSILVGRMNGHPRGISPSEPGRFGADGEPDAAPTITATREYRTETPSMSSPRPTKEAMRQI